MSLASSLSILRGGFLPRHDEDLREPLVRCQGSQVSMRVARGSRSWLSSHGRGLGSEGDKSWDFFGSNDAKAETPVLWPPHKLMCIELVMPSNHLILCRPLLLLPSIPPSIRVFSNESTLLMRWPKYWSFSFSISPSKEQV